MQFTYDAYRGLLSLLKQHDYETAGYHNWETKKRCVILRHDIDNSIECALRFAALEQECGVTSTYFVLLRSDFYNVLSRKSRDQLAQIRKMGHAIGLHFDEMAYPKIIGDSAGVKEAILQEAELLQHAINSPVLTVSMHRPSRAILNADLQIPGIVNSYSNVFFKQFKYLSDSRHHWREPVLDIVENEQYEQLHILTHAVGYGEENTSLQQWTAAFLHTAVLDRWNILNENFTDLDSVASRSKIQKELTDGFRT